jgi:hypothetical protein
MENKTYEEKIRDIMKKYTDGPTVLKSEIQKNESAIEGLKMAVEEIETSGGMGAAILPILNKKIESLEKVNEAKAAEIALYESEKGKQEMSNNTTAALAKLKIEMEHEKSDLQIQLKTLELEILKLYDNIDKNVEQDVNINDLRNQKDQILGKMAEIDRLIPSIEPMRETIMKEAYGVKKYEEDLETKMQEERKKAEEINIKQEEKRLQIETAQKEEEERKRRIAEEIAKNLSKKNGKDGKDSDKEENLWKRFIKWVKEKIEEIKKKSIEKQVAKLGDGSTIIQKEEAYYKSAKTYTSTEMAKEAREGKDEKGIAFKEALKVKLSDKNKEFDQEKFDRYVEEIEVKRKLKNKPKKIKESKEFKAKDKEKIKIRQKLAENRLKNKVKKVSSVYGTKKYETINKALDSYMKVDEYRRSANKDYDEREYRKEVRKMFKDKGDYKVFEAKLLEQDKTKQPLKEDEEMSR